MKLQKHENLSQIDVEDNLESKLLFNSTKNKKGSAKASINIQYLPNLFHLIKNKMASEEKSSIIDFELQSFLIELTLVKSLYDLKIRDLFSLNIYILEQIRSCPKYWIDDTEAKRKAAVIEEDCINLLRKYREQRINENETTTGDIFSSNNILQQSIGDNENSNQHIDDLVINPSIITEQSVNNLNNLNLFKQYFDKMSEIKSKYQTTQHDENKINDIIVSNKSDLVQTNIPFVAQSIQNNQHIVEEGDTINQNNLISWIGESLQERRRVTRKLAHQVYEEIGVANQFTKIVQQTQKSKMNIINIAKLSSPMFISNAYNCHPKIDLQLLPMIYQFLQSLIEEKCPELINVLYENNEFRFDLQNFFLFMILSQEDNFTSNRTKGGGVFLNSEETITPNQKSFIQRSQIMMHFYQYCIKNGLQVEKLISFQPQQKKNQLTLLNNVLYLGLCYVLRYNQKNIQIQNVCFNYLYSEINKEIPTNVMSCESCESNYSQQFANLQAENDIGDYDQHCKMIYYYKNEVEARILKNIATQEDRHMYFSMRQKYKDDHQHISGTFSSKQHIQQVVLDYKELIQSDSMRAQRAYKFHSDERPVWPNQMFKLLLSGLLKFYDVPINNQKIARFMGPNIRPNHVRYVKCKYLKRLKQRAKANQRIAKDMIQDDIDNFSMQLFQQNKFSNINENLILNSDLNQTNECTEQKLIQ